MGTNHSIDHPIIFFDGVCNLCNASVQFIIKRDKKALLKFASLQSKFAEKTLPEDLLKSNNLQTIILLHGDKILARSSAVLTISKHLSGLWPLLYGCIIFPKCIRDEVYDFIAKRRYKWFGKRDQCMIPSLESKSRFIE